MKTKQIDIAKQSGIHQATISNILKGRRRPSWKLAKRLTHAVPGTTVELWMEASPQQLQEAFWAAQKPSCHKKERAA